MSKTERQQIKIVIDKTTPYPIFNQCDPYPDTDKTPCTAPHVKEEELGWSQKQYWQLRRLN